MSDSERSYDEVWDSMWENEASDDEAGKTLSDNGSPGDEPLSKKPKLANESVFEFCKWIFYNKVDRERYSLLTEHDLARMVLRYNSFSYERPFTYYRAKKNMKSTIDDDILKAIRKVKLCPRLSVDQYTDLLIEMFTDRDMKCQESLIAKAAEIIDIETLYSLDAHSLSFIESFRQDSKSSPHEEFDSLLKFHLFKISIWRKNMVKVNVSDVVFPFHYLFFNVNILPLRGKFGPFIQVAEIRRKAERTRFINRDHFMWAFRESGYELPSMFMDIAASRNADDKADQPPYHIYVTAAALSKAALNDPGASVPKDWSAFKTKY